MGRLVFIRRRCTSTRRGIATADIAIADPSIRITALYSSSFPTSIPTPSSISTITMHAKLMVTVIAITIIAITIITIVIIVIGRGLLSTGGRTHMRWQIRMITIVIRLNDRTGTAKWSRIQFIHAMVFELLVGNFIQLNAHEICIDTSIIPELQYH